MRENFQVNGDTWESFITLQNSTQCGILFKVKCTSNARIEIDDCADILLPGNEVQVSYLRHPGTPPSHDEAVNRWEVYLYSLVRNIRTIHAYVHVHVLEYF
uniref:MSP domain-containing protein n=1 Tax=Angiostrongylus cantonensis TaxID=6313 RepID=A0A0K0D4V7_ANGCA